MIYLYEMISTVKKKKKKKTYLGLEPPPSSPVVSLLLRSPTLSFGPLVASLVVEPECSGGVVVGLSSSRLAVVHHDGGVAGGSHLLSMSTSCFVHEL